MLPVLLIVWAGVYFMYDRYAALQHAQLSARTCAWLWAGQACEGTLPAECEGVIRDAGPVDESGDTDEPIRQSVNSEAVRKATGDGTSLFDRVIGTILGNGFHARVARHVTLPAYLGAGNRDVHATEYLVCNEKERDLMDVIKGVSCAFGLKFAC